MNLTPSKIISDGALLSIYKNLEHDAVKTGEAVGLSASQVRKRLSRIRLAGDSETPTLIEAANEKPNHLQQLLKNASINEESIGSIAFVDKSEWGGGIKNKDGEWEAHGLYATKTRLYPHSPKFPLMQPAEPTTIIHVDVPRILRPVRNKVVLSDMQMGYLRDIDTGAMEPSHDPRAMEVARQIITDLQPTTVYGVGDRMDWPIFGRWQKRPEFFSVTQRSIQTGYEWAARFIAAAPPDCEHVEIPSNHQMRPETFLLEYNREALGLSRARRPGDATEWPVFSEAFLLRYDELGIKLQGSYPGGELFIFSDLAIMHAPPKPGEFSASVLHGHTHKQAIIPSVLHGYEGRQTFKIIDTGCLCQVGANINARRLLVMKVPGDRPRTNWHQGLCSIEYIEGKATQWQAHLIEIRNGSALFQGQGYYVPEDFEEGIDE